MEDWQVTQVLKYLPQLTKWTNCSTLLLAILQAKGVLGEDDLQLLECTKTSNCKAKLLYDILKTKQNAYYTLVNGLIETTQTGAASLLLEIPTKKISKLQVMFLGNVSSLEDLLLPDQINQIQSWLQKNSSLQELLKIHENILPHITPLQLLLDTIPEPYPFYIPRFLSRRQIVSPELFEIKCSDIFAFKNVERTELRNFVSSYGIEYSSSQLLQRKITARFIILAAESHWKKLCLKAKSPLHLLRFEDGTKRFLLEETLGDSDILRQYLRNTEKTPMEENTSDDESEGFDRYVLVNDGASSSSDSGDDEFLNNKSENDVVLTEISKCANKSQDDVASLPISEDSLVENVLTDKEKCICICDLPGMGKSFLLASLAKKVNEKCPNRIVSFIQLQNFKLATASSSESQEDLHEQILAQLATSKFSHCILTELVKCSNVKFELFFDGLDEVKKSHLEFTTVFLQKLANSTSKVRVFVTSRPVVQAKLEKMLRVIAYDIVPFNTETQVMFLTSHWEQMEPDADVVKLEEYARFCLKGFKQFLKRKEKNITGIPLQCKLIADVYSANACVYADKNCKIPMEFPSDFTHSLLEIYSKFITRLLGESNCNFECLYKTGLLEAQCNTECHVRNFHVWQALQLIFPELSSQLADLVVHFDEVNLYTILAPGILKKNTQSQNWEFLHKTFAEYLVAEYFWKGVFLNARKENTERQRFLANIVFNEIFSAGSSSTLFIWTFAWNHESMVAYFLDCMISESQSNENQDLRCVAEKSPFDDAYFHVLNACIYLQYEGLLELYFTATINYIVTCKSRKAKSQYGHEKNLNVELEKLRKNEKYEDIILDKPMASHILKNAATYCCGQKVQKIYIFFMDVLSIDLNDYAPPPIIEAINTADYELVQYFAKMLDLENKGLIYECLGYTYFNCNEIIEKKLDIAQFLLSRCPSLVTETWKNKKVVYKTPIHVPQSSVSVLKFLVQRGCEVLTPNEKGKSVVYLAAEYMSDEDFFELCRFICFDCKAQNYFLDPENWVDYVSDFKCWVKTRPSKFLFKILCSLKIELAFIENIPTLKKLGFFEKYKLVFHSLLYSAFRERKLDFADLLLSHDNSLLELKCYQKANINMAPDLITATLYTAACKKLKILKFFVSRGSNIFAVNSRKQTVIHLAAETGNIGFFHAVLCMLFEKWNNIQKINEMAASLFLKRKTGNAPRNILELINWMTVYFETPLHYAVAYLNGLPLEILDLLLCCGRKHVNAKEFTLINMNARNFCGKTALHIALENGQRLELIKHLINRGADWTLADDVGCNVANYCSVNLLVEHLKYFVELGFDLNAFYQNGKTFLLGAVAAEQSLVLIKYLVTCGADWSVSDQEGRDAIHFCSQKGLLEHLKYFVELGCDVNTVTHSGWTPLLLALFEAQSLELVKYLTGSGADWSISNKKGWNAIHFCSQKGLQEHLKYFVELGCDVNAITHDGRTPLSVALSNAQSLELVKFLVTSGADWSKLNENGWNAVHFCAVKGLLEHLKYFVELGCDLNAADALGYTPVLLALATEQSLDLVKYLVSCGAKWSSRNNHGSNATHICASCGLLDHLKFFVMLGCDVNVIDGDGYNALQCVIVDCKSSVSVVLEIIQVLITAGVDKANKNQNVKTAYNYAVEKEHPPEVLHMLL